MVKKIAGYENYTITDEGVIYSEKRNRYPGGFLRPTKTENGYLRVKLKNDHENKSYYVHRLVAMAFIPNPDNKKCVNHKDGNKENNCVDNLEWCTYSENMKHAVAHGLNHNPDTKGENHPSHKLSAVDVVEIRRLSAQGVMAKDIAKKYGITTEQVYNIRNFKQWKSVPDCKTTA